MRRAGHSAWPIDSAASSPMPSAIAAGDAEHHGNLPPSLPDRGGGIDAGGNLARSTRPNRQRPRRD